MKGKQQQRQQHRCTRLVVRSACCLHVRRCPRGLIPFDLLSLIPLHSVDIRLSLPPQVQGSNVLTAHPHEFRKPEQAGAAGGSVLPEGYSNSTLWMFLVIGTLLFVICFFCKPIFPWIWTCYVDFLKEKQAHVAWADFGKRFCQNTAVRVRVGRDSTGLKVKKKINVSRSAHQRVYLLHGRWRLLTNSSAAFHRVMQFDLILIFPSQRFFHQL